MNTNHLSRLLAVAVLCLCHVAAFGQEPPVEPPAPAESQAPAEQPAGPPEEAASAVAESPAPAPAESAAPVQAEAPEPVPAEGAAPAGATASADAAPSAGAKRIVMLPVAFTVYQRSVAGLEAVPDWTETATFSLGDAASQMLRRDSRFEIVALPEFDGDAEGLLVEHVEFFKLIATNVSTLKTFGGKAWNVKWDNFDYSLGDGLRFLADASGADYAFILAGLQIAQTGGQAFMQFMIGGAGGGTFVAAGIVDLRDGAIRWFNYREGAQVFGMTGTDVRKPETAAEIVTAMFAGFPEVKVVRLPAF